ncbi:uncharacterized protein DNG_03964 [Cephalotrichum gorgonifer]|uniref:N-acetyltransferase domain-containing protein n=1 Tax=Cephalotrichum gorgonifer TaxID=2041049 RepID=A0AAE8SUR5_9PEZI|nr:uncharacterized protein DNG_03964 [Cephalotrichum gorgonifer]
MSFIVLPAALPDIRAIYDVWFASFKGQLIVDLLYPDTNIDDEAFRKAHAEGTLGYWKGLTMEHTFKCVDLETGRIAGMATWQVYWRERTTEERAKPWIGWLEGAQRERAEAFLGQLWEKHCHTVAVHPDYQGKGVGKKLVQWGLGMSEELKLPIYLESTVEGVPLYERTGFQKLKEGITLTPAVTHMKEDIEAPLMVKMPASAGGMAFEEWASGRYQKQ